MTDPLSTGWADVEASILADSAAGLSIPKIAARTQALDLLKYIKADRTSYMEGR